MRSYMDNHVGALNFSEGDCITVSETGGRWARSSREGRVFQVLERNPTGQWRGFILQEDLTTRIGYFPSTYVQSNNTSKLARLDRRGRADLFDGFRSEFVIVA